MCIRDSCVIVWGISSFVFLFFVSFSFLLFFCFCVKRKTHQRTTPWKHTDSQSTQIFSRREKIWFLRLKTARGQASASTRVTVRIRSRECSISIRRFQFARVMPTRARARMLIFFRLFRLKFTKEAKLLRRDLKVHIAGTGAVSAAWKRHQSHWNLVETAFVRAF